MSGQEPHEEGISMADKEAMSCRVARWVPRSSSFNHQVEQLEKSAVNASVNWRARSQPLASPNPKFRDNLDARHERQARHTLRADSRSEQIQQPGAWSPSPARVLPVPFVVELLSRAVPRCPRAASLRLFPTHTNSYSRLELRIRVPSVALTHTPAIRTSAHARPSLRPTNLSPPSTLISSASERHRRARSPCSRLSLPPENHASTGREPPACRRRSARARYLPSTYARHDPLCRAPYVACLHLVYILANLSTPHSPRPDELKNATREYECTHESSRPARARGTHPDGLACTNPSPRSPQAGLASYESGAYRGCGAASRSAIGDTGSQRCSIASFEHTDFQDVTYEWERARARENAGMWDAVSLASNADVA
ncbi:hypothetical protein C8R45DRAFT_921887 [Mycena sanguinolenta]|nr:hypothetical protein C8R45DRAFT_921887 [Mycena sanguinolenta]